MQKSEMTELLQSVEETLRRASERTGLTPVGSPALLTQEFEPPEFARSRSGTGSVDRQRELCSTLQTQLDGIRSANRGLEEDTRREVFRAELLEKELAMVEAVLSLEIRKRQMVERRLAARREEATSRENDGVPLESRADQAWTTVERILSHLSES